MRGYQHYNLNDITTFDYTPDKACAVCYIIMNLNPTTKNLFIQKENETACIDSLATKLEDAFTYLEFIVKGNKPFRLYSMPGNMAGSIYISEEYGECYVN